MWGDVGAGCLPISPDNPRARFSALALSGDITRYRCLYIANHAPSKANTWENYPVWRTWSKNS